MNYVTYDNMISILNGIATKISNSSGGTDFKEWVANTAYTKDEIIVYDGQMYKVTDNLTSGSTFSTDNLEKYIPKGLTNDEMDALVDAFNPSGSSSNGGGAN